MKELKSTENMTLARDVFSTLSNSKSIMTEVSILRGLYPTEVSIYLTSANQWTGFYNRDLRHKRVNDEKFSQKGVHCLIRQK